MLDVDALARATLNERPFRWAHVARSFSSPQAAIEAARSAPRAGFESTVHERGADKRYRMANRTLIDRNRIVDGALDDLSPTWRALVAQLTSPGYRAAIASLTGRPVDDAELQVRLCRYDAGCWLDPHTDRPDKLVTHVVYLNERWERLRGGGLRILRSERLDDVEREIMPALDAAIVLVRSDSSWHAVAPVRQREAERTSLLIHLMRPAGT